MKPTCKYILTTPAVRCGHAMPCPYHSTCAQCGGRLGAHVPDCLYLANRSWLDGTPKHSKGEQ